MLTKPIFSGLIAVGLGLVGLGLTATQPQALPHASLGQTWQDGTYAQTVQYRRDYGRRYGYGHGHGYGRGYGYGRQYGYGLAGLGVLGLLGGAAITARAIMAAAAAIMSAQSDKTITDIHAASVSWSATDSGLSPRKSRLRGWVCAVLARSWSAPCGLRGLGYTARPCGLSASRV